MRGIRFVVGEERRINCCLNVFAVIASQCAHWRGNPPVRRTMLRQAPTSSGNPRFLEVIVTWFHSSGGLPHQRARWFAMTGNLKRILSNTSFPGCRAHRIVFQNHPARGCCGWLRSAVSCPRKPCGKERYRMPGSHRQPRDCKISVACAAGKLLTKYGGSAIIFIT